MSSAETRMTGDRVPDGQGPGSHVPVNRVPSGGVPVTEPVPLAGTVPATGAVPPTGAAPHPRAVPPTGATPPLGAVPPRGAVPPADEEEPTLGQLVGDLAEDLSRLMRQELELAKAEIRQEATKAGKAAGMLGAAGFAGYMTAVLLSFALAFGLGSFMGLGWATLVVAVLWGIGGFALYSTGRARLRKVNPKPERTIETLKEDAEWARHPTK
ncbi:phage holin family protein [Saccharothrix texasensis]|uniref:Putative superfamily III holin-X n=1 Tax=Saccharothrix texasensis TaxID=103734 RepID=A0A3N1H2C7_9PSEU|nr:phage holin family protein [Saccharothrix texasensis]ROP36412.1 putative superfamily III holin-X [Saccharothrix texasensis]